jgi:hypothetical protein
LFFLAILLQLSIIFLLSDLIALALKMLFILFSYALLTLGVILNLHLWAVRIMGLGVLMNLIVMIANGGLMPVSPEAISRAGLQERLIGVELGQGIPGSKGVLLPLTSTRLWWLSDIFAISLIHKVFSPGDVLIGCGWVVSFFEVIKLKSKRKR